MHMFFFPKAMTALYALAQINHVQSQDLSISQISTRDPGRLLQVLEYGCDDAYPTPMTDLEATRLRVADIQEVLAQTFMTDETNPELRKYKSHAIATLSESISQTRKILSRRIDPRALINNLHTLQKILVSNNIAQIHPELNTLISILQAHASVMLSQERINTLEESIYKLLSNEETEQLLQFALRRLDIACKTKKSINLAYNSYCYTYVAWEKAVLETAYQQLPQASMPADKTLLKVIMKKHRAYLCDALAICKINASTELLELLDAIAQEIGHYEIQIYTSAQQM